MENNKKEKHNFISSLFYFFLFYLNEKPAVVRVSEMLIK